MNNYIKKSIKAVAQIRSHDDKQVLGYIEFNQLGDKTTIKGVLHGSGDEFSKGYHGMHIHEKGDPRKCCDALGDHYNPFGKSHGDIGAQERHVGDLGNVLFDANGNCTIDLTDSLIKLTGPYSIIGRSLIIHKDIDDLGKGNSDKSKINGNSGARIAYGIIGYA